MVELQLLTGPIISTIDIDILLLSAMLVAFRDDIDGLCRY